MIVCNKGWKPLGCKTKIKSKADTEKLSVIAACLHRFVPLGRPTPRTLFNDFPAKVWGHLSTYSPSRTKAPPNNCSLRRWVHRTPGCAVSHHKHIMTQTSLCPRFPPVTSSSSSIAFCLLPCTFLHSPKCRLAFWQITSKRFLVEARILLQCVNHSLFTRGWV